MYPSSVRSRWEPMLVCGTAKREGGIIGEAEIGDSKTTLPSGKERVAKDRIFLLEGLVLWGVVAGTGANWLASFLAVGGYSWTTIPSFVRKSCADFLDLLFEAW